MSNTNISQLKVVNIPKKDKLITINEGANLSSALKVLIDNKILSAPVVKGDGVVIGQLDVVDLVVFVVHLSKRAQEIFVGLGLIGEDQIINFSDIHVNEKLDTLFHVYDESASIANFSKRNPIKSITYEQSFEELFAALVHNHRVVVLNSEGKIQDYITQSDVIKVLYKNKDIIGNRGSKTISELNLGTSEVICISDHQLVVEAFKQIAIKNISAVAVLNKDGNFIGDIGAHDIREINPEGDMIDTILLSANDYLISKGRKPFTVSSSTTLDVVINTFEQNHIHRLWIVQENKLKGVISLGDVFKILLN